MKLTLEKALAHTIYLIIALSQSKKLWQPGLLLSVTEAGMGDTTEAHSLCLYYKMNC